MANKNNVTRDERLEWNRFAKIPVSDAVPGIYAEATAFSLRARTWYWQSIGTKRFWSTSARGLSYLLAVFGVVAPLVAAVAGSDTEKLTWTQAGVVAFALAGLIQVGDKAFGWSSGWLRYVTTVTAMERLSLQFELDWTQHLLLRAGQVTDEDVKPLFDIAKQFQTDIEKRRSDETDLWVGEFNAGLAALNEMIRAQKEATEKSAEATRSALETRTQQQRTGAIEATLVQTAKPPSPVTIFLDEEEQPAFVGGSWAALGVVPGLHHVRAVIKGTQMEAHKAVDVPPGATVAVELKFL